MARLEDLALSHRLFMKGYRYRSVDWSPGPGWRSRSVKPGWHWSRPQACMFRTSLRLIPRSKVVTHPSGNWRRMWRLSS